VAASAHARLTFLNPCLMPLKDSRLPSAARCTLEQFAGYLLFLVEKGPIELGQMPACRLAIMVRSAQCAVTNRCVRKNQDLPHAKTKAAG